MIHVKQVSMQKYFLCFKNHLLQYLFHMNKELITTLNGGGCMKNN